MRPIARSPPGRCTCVVPTRSFPSEGGVEERLLEEAADEEHPLVEGGELGHLEVPEVGGRFATVASSSVVALDALELANMISRNSRGASSRQWAREDRRRGGTSSSPLSTWRIGFGGLRGELRRRRAHVGAGDDRVPVAVELQQRLPVRRAREPGQLEQRRHEVDRAHLRLDDVGIEPGGREHGGTSTTSSKSVAPSMW